MRGFLEKARHASRALARNKRFATLAILSLGVAIALNTTMYSVLDAIVFPKVAMHRPEQLYELRFFGDYRRVIPDQERTDAIRALSFYSDMTRRLPNFSGGVAERGSTVRIARVMNIAPNYFAVLGNQPSAGRLLSAADLNASTTPVVLSERLWNRLFPNTTFSDTATFILDGEPRVVVGLLPHNADFPGYSTDIWQIPVASAQTYNPTFFGLLRLKDNVPPAVAQGELNVLAAEISKRTSQGRTDDARFVLKSAVAPGQLKALHMALIGAVIFVLLVACVNLANLQLARGVSRSRELATRAAIGASRRDLITQLLLESGWLALGGLVLGTLLTVIGMKLVIAALPPALDEYMLRPQTSWRVFTFAGVVSLACLGIVGLVPAVRLSRVDINEVLKTGAGTGTNRRKRLQYGALVVVQVSLALALCVGATMLLRAAIQIEGLELRPGMERLVQTYTRTMPVGDNDGRKVVDIATQLVSKARAIPGVADAAAFTMMRPAGRMITITDDGGASKQVGTGMWSHALVTSAYVRTLGIPIIKGRDFFEGEFAEPSIIVDEQTARYLWPGADPIGKLVKMGDIASDRPWLRVVGVTEYFNYWVPFHSLNQEERLAARMGAVYVLNARDATPLGKGAGLQLVVKGTINVHRLPAFIQRDLTDPASGVRVLSAATLNHELGLDMLRARQRFITSIFMTFALLALAVAALGVYAIVSHTVSQRTREFGVRMAIGASHRDIGQSVLREGNLLALIGVAVGLILASQTVGFLGPFLRDAEARFDSWLYAVAAAVLFAAIIAASWIPARRAMRINPVEALRND